MIRKNIICLAALALGLFGATNASAQSKPTKLSELKPLLERPLAEYPLPSPSSNGSMVNGLISCLALVTLAIRGVGGKK